MTEPTTHSIIEIPINPNEGMLIELSAQMKDLCDEKDDQYKKLAERYMDTKKILHKCYGMIRIIQEELDRKDELLGSDAYIIDWLIAEMRGNISDYMFMKEEKRMGIYGY